MWSTCVLKNAKNEKFPERCFAYFLQEQGQKKSLKMPSLTLWSRILCKIYPAYQLAGTFWILRGRDLKVARTLNLLIWSQTRYQLRHEASPVVAKVRTLHYFFIIEMVLWYITQGPWIRIISHLNYISSLAIKWHWHSLLNTGTLSTAS